MSYHEELREYNTGSMFITRDVNILPGSVRAANVDFRFIQGSGNIPFAAAFGTSGAIMVSGPDFKIGSGDFSVSLFYSTTLDSAASLRIVDFSGATVGAIGIQISSTEAFRCFFSDVGSLTSVTTGSTGYNDGLYHHVVMARNIGSDILYVYVDGAINKSGADICNTGSTIGAGANMGIFNQSTSVSNSVFALGSLMDLRFYNKCLSAGEVGSLYSGLHVGANLVGWWRFSEGAGSFVFDSSATRNSVGSAIPNTFYTEPINGTIEQIQITNISGMSVGSLLFNVSGTNERLFTYADAPTSPFYPFTYAVDNTNETGSPFTMVKRVVNNKIAIIGSELQNGLDFADISIKYW